MKYYLTFLFLFVFAFLSFCLITPNARALTMDYIGGVSTQGKSYSRWYTTALQPRIGGTADVGATVDVSVGSQSGSVPTDADGNWWWDPPAPFAAGDYTTSITDGSETLSFTLTLGSSLPSSTQSATGGAVPSTGVVWPGLIVGLAAFLSLIWGSFRMAKRTA